MSDETRRVIAVVDELVPHKEAIAFPTVRAWIRSPNDIELHNIRAAFPTQGEVFLHTSHSDNQKLVRHHVGLFTCIRSKGQHNAHWEVASALRSLARVIDYPSKTFGPHFFNLWKWLTTYRDSDHCNILLGDGTVYVGRGASEIVGPFSLGADGTLVSNSPVFTFDDVTTARVEIASRPYSFVDGEFLPTGKPLILDPREAILRRLKFVHRKNQFSWLSRDKIQALATAAANALAADGSDWVNEHFADVLTAAYDSVEPDEAVINAILSVPKLADSIETAWTAKHAGQVSKAKEESGKVLERVSDLKAEEKQLEKGISELTAKNTAARADLEKLHGEIENTRSQASRLFDDELKRLAKSPATLALFSSWLTTVGGNTSDARIIVGERDRGDEERVGDLHEALRANFRSAGLTALGASELATASAAAIAAGQCIAFQSTYSDVLTHAAAVACAECPIIAANIPAGLLDPVAWEQYIPSAKRLVLLLQGTNRSDVSLVLGTLRLPLLRQILGIQRMEIFLFLGLESQTEVRVEGEIPIGPIFDDRLISIDVAKASTKMCSAPFEREVGSQIAPIDQETFISELGETISKLPILRAPSSAAVYRRAYAALRERTSDSKEARKIFFKHWCVARLARPITMEIVTAHKQEWERDEILFRLSESEFASE